MARILVYYPFKRETWFGRSVKHTLNETKHDIFYISENYEEDKKRLEFQRTMFHQQNKVYIVGHCSVGDDTLGSEDPAEEIGYRELARKLSAYTGQNALTGDIGLSATIKILACKSGSMRPGAAVFDFLGLPAPPFFLSFAQKLWNELYHTYGFRCRCQAYTKTLLWETSRVSSKKAVKPAALNAQGPNRFFREDDEGPSKDNMHRARNCRIDVLHSPRGN